MTLGQNPGAPPTDSPPQHPIRDLAGAIVTEGYVVWRNEAVPEKDRHTKVPYGATGKASATNPKTWVSLDRARAIFQAGRHDGLGVILRELKDRSLLCGIDLDTCRNPETGEPTKPWVAPLLDRLASYTEVSPSRTGWKVFFLIHEDDREDTLALVRSPSEPKRSGRQWKEVGSGTHPPGIELYLRDRYFALTFKHQPGTPTTTRRVCVDTLRWMIEEVGPSVAGRAKQATKRKAQKPRDQSSPNSGESAISGHEREPALDSWTSVWLLTRHAAAEAKFQNLLDGDISELGEDRSRSAIAWNLVRHLKAAGLDEEAAQRALSFWPHGDMSDYVTGRQWNQIWSKLLARDDARAVGRNEIWVVDGTLPQMIEQTIAGIQAKPGQVFVQSGSGKLVRLCEAPGTDGEPARVVISQMDRIAVRDEATRAITFLKLKPPKSANLWDPTNCPPEVADGVLSRSVYPALRTLLGIAHTPILRRDMTVAQSPGYDEQTRIFIDLKGVDFERVPDMPTRDDALAALSVLEAPISHYRFETSGAEGTDARSGKLNNEASRAATLAMLLTAVVRPTLPTAPMFAITATTAGSGKGKLADVAALMATGRVAAVIAMGKAPEELPKQLDAMLLAGKQVIVLDNISSVLDNDTLNACLTQSVVSLRPMRTSELHERSTNALFIATGNNLEIAGDLSRRCVLISLDPGIESPHTQSFPFCPVEMTRARRPEFVVAALTIVRAYYVAGRPKQHGLAFGSFDVWAKTIRDPLMWLGLADPVETMVRIRAADPQSAMLEELLQAWWAHNMWGETTAKELVRGADQRLRDALRAIAPTHPSQHGEGIDPTRLGNFLSRNKGKIVTNLRIVHVGKTNGSNRWKIERPANVLKGG